ncbi:hypothetical protein AYO07_19735 [Escherichia coli]|uniref:hypothetical protein n=1 Tax=Escherichia coli TaxID=562 RepID=UPI0007DC0281|nr:hypothetical protein [Escherichia coli]OAS02873.1 hypothetical protein AYO07_19735 [Escherichia coli]HAL7502283.1 hypothetical protein [Escherichia coli]
MGFGKLRIEATNTDHVMVVHKDTVFGEVDIKSDNAKSVVFTFSDPRDFEFFDNALSDHPEELKEIVKRLNSIEQASFEEKEKAVHESKFFQTCSNVASIADLTTKLIDLASKVNW